MKIRIIIAALVLSALSIHAQDQFILKGKIGRADAPGQAYLLYKNGREIITDSATLHNGAFEFNGHLKEPTMARLIVDHHGVGFAKTTKDADMIMMYLEKGTIVIDGSDSLRLAKISGSAINDDYVRYEAFMDGATKENFLQRQFEFIRTNPDSYVSFYTLRAAAVPVIDVPVIEPLFNNLTERIRSTVAAIEFKELIDKKKAVSVGQVAPDFTQSDVNGKPVSLSDFRGKYVLIDFWASWCVPCRAENPYVVKAYQAFKDRGFDVLSISLDRPGKREDWLKAIEKDKLSWTNVSDLLYWNNAVALQYGIKSIPQNFLLDRKGMIVAENLRGEQLQEKLKELID